MFKRFLPPPSRRVGLRHRAVDDGAAKALMLRLICAFVAQCALLATGCGIGQGEATDDAPARTAAMKTAPNARQLGEAIRELYLRAISETASMLRDKPSPDLIGARSADLRQQWIEEMVALGRQVEKLDEADRKRVEADVRSMYRQLQSDPELSADWQAFSASINAYVTTDPAFYRELKPLNILTQYAFFDLLRRQAPEEAARLGLSAPATSSASTSQAPTAEGDPP